MVNQIYKVHWIWWPHVINVVFSGTIDLEINVLLIFFIDYYVSVHIKRWQTKKNTGERRLFQNCLRWQRLSIQGYITIVVRPFIKKIKQKSMDRKLRIIIKTVAKGSVSHLQWQSLRRRISSSCKGAGFDVFLASKISKL